MLHCVYVCMYVNQYQRAKKNVYHGIMVDQEKAGEEVGEGREKKDQEGGEEGEREERRAAGLGRRNGRRKQ